MRSFCFPWVVALLCLAGAGPTQPPAKAADWDLAQDEAQLKKAGLPTDGRGLLAYFRKWSPGGVEADRVAALVRQLGSRSFKEREAASRGLVDSGPGALAGLGQAVQDVDPEVSRRARACIAAIGKRSEPTVVVAAVHVLADRRPPGATAALLHYLPAAGEEAEEEVLEALLALAGRDGPQCVPALESKEPARRAAAALVLGRFGTAADRDAVRRLLADADPKVRLRAAHGLVAGKDKRAVPVLVALLTGSPADIGRQAEELLGCLAGKQAPAVTLGETAAERRRCQEAWNGWWMAHGEKLDLAGPAVDVPICNPTLRARETTRRFLRAIVQGDLALFRRTTDVPFLLPGSKPHTTREELDKFFTQEMKDNRNERQLAFTVKSVVRLEEYARTADPKVLARLGSAREIRVVYFQIRADGEVEELVAFGRVTGGKVRVVGIGEARPPEKKRGK